VDLSGVTAIDSSGLNQLISLATHARMCGSQLVLFGPTPFVAGVLEITKLDKWFDVAEDEPAAVGRLQEKQE
jgi:anti-anti-sigma factor